jgi:hypothetical protein
MVRSSSRGVEGLIASLHLRLVYILVVALSKTGLRLFYPINEIYQAF